jgi:hypothetical protein
MAELTALPVNLYACIQDVFSSNLGWNTGYPDSRFYINAAIIIRTGQTASSQILYNSLMSLLSSQLHILPFDTIVPGY